MQIHYELCSLAQPKMVKDNAIALAVKMHPLQSSKCFFISVDSITMLLATIASIPGHKEAMNTIHCVMINPQAANHRDSVHCFKLI